MSIVFLVVYIDQDLVPKTDALACAMFDFEKSNCTGGLWSGDYSPAL